jgi:ABC-type Zn2+ transport system substrate-binding protein/surface adhesin
VLAERLAQIADSGALRLEKRLSQITAGMERQRDESLAAFDARLAQAETEVRRRLQAIAAEIDSDRTVMQARLQELARRIDETFARTP